MEKRICNDERNHARCTCTYEPCPRKGFCCDCLEYHWSHRQLPGCLFPPEAEATYDRSLRAFIAAWRRHGY